MCPLPSSSRTSGSSQEDYYGLAGFFTRLGRKSFGEPPPYFACASVTTGEKNPLTDKSPEPKYLDGEYAKFSRRGRPAARAGRLDGQAGQSAISPRRWSIGCGATSSAAGLVHEVDDLRQTNPPSNPELLDALAKDFIEHKFDVKHVIRTLLNSQVYQLSARADATRTSTTGRTSPASTPGG